MESPVAENLQRAAEVLQEVEVATERKSGFNGARFCSGEV